jgi:hypothetical protein
MWYRLLKAVGFPALWGLLAVGLLLPQAAPAQEEVTSSIRRYKEREASTGYYEEYEVKPRRQRPMVGVPGVLRKTFPYAPKAAQIRVRTNLADSHRAIRHYEMRRCEECHVDQARDIHTVRGNLTCRQCHGGEPIAAINHYFSPMNPIRRHAYVCAKCHEEAGVSFATYLVHEPKAGAPETRKTFPALYYSNWFMMLLLVGVFVFFIPHSVIWVAREFFTGKKKEKTEPEKTDDESNG